MEDELFIVSVTAIVFNANGKMLITKRASTKKRWPDKWTVPGGRVSSADFIGTPTEINNQWYGTLEAATRREVLEEVGLSIDNIEYLTSIAIPGGMIISYTANATSDVIQLQEEETDAYAWVSAKEAEKYDLIDGILRELYDAERRRTERNV